MTWYRKLPISIEAIQWKGDNSTDVAAFTSGKWYPDDGRREEGITALVYDELHSTWVGMHDGDWVIKGIQGEFYPCRDDVFRTTYERLPGEDS